MEISKRITKHKLGNLDHKEGAGVDVDEDFQQILITYHGKNMFWLLSTISVQNLWWLVHHRNEEYEESLFGYCNQTFDFSRNSQFCHEKVAGKSLRITILF